MASRTSPRPTGIRWSEVIGKAASHRPGALDAAMLYAAHETKTALMVVDVTLSLVRRALVTGRPPDPADLETAQAALQRASALLEEILACGGARPLRQAPVDLKQVLGSVANMLRVMARGDTRAGRSVEIVERYSQERCTILGDRELVEASLINLGFNSLQALGTTGGTVWLEAVRDGTRAVIRVRDTGPGFADGSSEGLLQSGRTPRKGGTGLGLPIARASIEAHHGSLTLRNLVGGGAEAVVRLPLLEDVPES